jgi:hypothetical protein
MRAMYIWDLPIKLKHVCMLHDIAPHENSILSVQHGLLLCHFHNVCHHGDIGRVAACLPYIAIWFQSSSGAYMLARHFASRMSGMFYRQMHCYVDQRSACTGAATFGYHSSTVMWDTEMEKVVHYLTEEMIVIYVPDRDYGQRQSAPREEG